MELKIIVPEDGDDIIHLAASIANTAAILLASGKATIPSTSYDATEHSPEAAAIDSALMLYTLAFARLVEGLEDPSEQQ